MVLLCLSGSFIWWLPYLADVFYVPMQKIFEFSNTQIGMLYSTTGMAAMATYLPGGWLADRYPPRQLMSVALAISGLGGFVMARIPSFEVCLVLYALWGVSAGLIFWSALIKATRYWGGHDEQGRAFGLLEGGRSLSDAIFPAIFLAVFAWQGADSEALSYNITLTSYFLLIMATLVWWVMKDSPSRGPDTTAAVEKFSWARLHLVLRMPVLWLLSLVILATNWGMWGTVFFTPYATDIYGLGDVWGGAVGVAKYWLAAVAAICAGIVADRIGTARTVVGLFLFMTAGFLLFALVPGSPFLLAMLLINSAMIAVSVYALRGIYYALLESGGVPIALTGTAVGMVSFIGYTPDAIAPVVSGLVLDNWPSPQGFQILFLLISSICLVGLVAAVMIYRRLPQGGERQSRSE